MEPTGFFDLIADPELTDLGPVVLIYGLIDPIFYD